MSNWLFALVVLAFGVLLAVFVDRLKDKPGPSQARKERRKWLYYWFLGRFPTREEMEDGEKDEKDKPK
ncbi:MAG: hypothetical protein A2051_11675 [Desulfovibrionales bacterium GWA2_65_9]|nr:MAG: hypothetical protein A2051_11675 [Desulfovibrionales bacterium GWA2_65_9]